MTTENHQNELGIENFIAMLLSGRAAEQTILGDGADCRSRARRDSDLARATQAAVDLELCHGLGSMGLVYFSDRASEVFLNDPRVAETVKRRLDRCLGRACDLIDRNRSTVIAVAAALEASGYLDRERIAGLLADHPLSVGPST